MNAKQRFGKFLLTCLVLTSAPASGQRSQADELAIDVKVSKLAQDPAFKEMMDIIFLQMRKSAAQLYDIDKNEGTTFQSASTEYLRKLEHSGNIEVPIPAAFKKYYVLDSDTLRHWEGLARELHERHPSIASPAEVALAADESTYTRNGIETGISSIDENYCDRVDCECTAACAEEYRVAYNQTGWKWVKDSITDPRPFGFIINFIKMAKKVHELGIEEIDCLRSCEGVDLPDRCFNDSDCSATQYCKKPFGNPFHRCVDRKSEPRTCTRHAQCTSSCCKYNPASHPFSKVCRPANRCN